MIRGNTIPIQPAGETLMSQYPPFPVSMSFQEPGPMTSQNPPDPIIQPVAYDQPGPLMSVAPPMPVEASFVPTDPSRRQDPPGPLVMSFVPTDPLFDEQMPPAFDMAPPTAPRYDQKGTGYEPIRAQEVPPGIKASQQPPEPAPVASMLGPDDIRPPDPAPRAEWVPPTPSKSQFPPQPAPMMTEVPPGMKSDLPPGMTEVGTGYKNVVPLRTANKQFPPEPAPMMTEVPIGFEPVKCTEMPPGYSYIAA